MEVSGPFYPAAKNKPRLYTASKFWNPDLHPYCCLFWCKSSDFQPCDIPTVTQQFPTLHFAKQWMKINIGAGVFFFLLYNSTRDEEKKPECRDMVWTLSSCLEGFYLFSPLFLNDDSPFNRNGRHVAYFPDYKSLCCAQTQPPKCCPLSGIDLHLTEFCAVGMYQAFFW